MNAANDTDSGAGSDVLVVDDTPESLRLLVEVLGKGGYRARPAGNGELALRSARAKPPALILLDVMMPDMDGFEVCRRLKDDVLTRDIPVIFVTGLAERVDKFKGFTLGAVDYVTKPFNVEEVLARVRAHLALVAAKEKLRIRNLQLQQANEQLSGEIEERKRAETALRESRDRLEDIYATVGDGIISLDSQQRIVLFNAAAERIFGYTAEELIGRPLDALLPERFRRQHARYISQFDAGGQNIHAVGSYRPICGLRKSGEEFPVEAAVSQSGISPNKLFTVILRDITERRQAEQAREQLMQQLEALSERLAVSQEEERGRIAYELNEELAQELMTLKLYLGMIGNGNGGTKSNAPRDEAKSMVVHAAERVRKLVLNLEPPELVELGLDAAVRTYCRQQAEAGGWILNLDAPKPAVRLPRAVEQACFRLVQEGLSNVLSHAKASEVWVELHRHGNELELVLRDNGVGFDRNAGDDNKPDGGGLGLFGMQVRAKQAGGSVEIDSTPGAGTVVRAVFPLPAASD